ncbi:hypothetical protein [uncultured Thalassolituus sp.]|uniref:hypothetical protein n=1 Tax=uncultured Thalassolituus sp. TaxID=285273 RepID=UPI002631A6D1|nr:hypothetical protein [uncultured Thalassolituus sp.]
MLRWLLSCSLLFSLPAAATDWEDYPDDLPAFNYEGSALKEHWADLTAITQVDYPDANWLRSMMEQYPRLAIAVLEAASGDDVHPAVAAAIHKTDYEPLAAQLQQVWRLHFAGRFKEAYELGMTLGPFGQIPAVYSRLIHATLLVKDKDEKLEEFNSAAEQSNVGLTLAAGYDFALFGLVYARVRTLELMSTGEARSSGYIPYSQETLKELRERNPEQAIYPATQGGLEAGIVERVGSFLGSITYGATESSSKEAFEKAMALEHRVPAIYYEYAVALSRLDADDYRKKIRELTSQCATLTVHTAEEALNQLHCRQLSEKTDKRK